MLIHYVQTNKLGNYEFYVDDGYSGTSFERPDFERLLDDIEKGRVSTVITKDLSRLGRDYLKTGFNIESYFPEHKVRFIAINDNVDIHKESNDYTPLKISSMNGMLKTSVRRLNQLIMQKHLKENLSLHLHHMDIKKIQTINII